MKKILAFLIAAVMAIACTSCLGTGDSELQEKTYTIGVVDGAPALAVTNLSDGYTYKGASENVTVKTEITSNPQQIVAGMNNGTFDMAIVPLNLASTLYNKAAKVGAKLVSVNIFSVLYVVGQTEMTDLSSLKGKVVYSVGEGGTPELVLKKLLAANNIAYEDGETAEDPEKVYVKMVSEAPLAIAALKKGNYALLGEPVVTQAMAKTGAAYSLDLSEEWEKVYGSDNAFVQAGLVVNEKVAGDLGFIHAFVKKMSENKNYLYANVSDISSKLQSMGSNLSVSFTAETLDRCHIGCETAKSQKSNVEAFLSAFDASKIGGKLPGEDFYLI